ncbi:MAG: hypothetical protein VX438_07020, partial [Planctomycetota bacterium]|nr:hypothetical protein [Planctomycetota bacterium]
MIKVPVVPDHELPEIVRFQAIRQFTNCTEDSPVDFLSLSESGEEKRVLAATIPKNTIDNLKTGCLSAGLNVKGVKLRATCTTALSQSITTDRKNYIILNPADKTFNLEVVAYGKLCLTRTIRATSDNPSLQIISEVRRTLAAAKNQIQDYEAKSVVIFGEESNFGGLRAEIEKELNFDVEFINPFDHVKGLKHQPEKPGNYASLVGLLVDHAAKTTETIDFLNPRKPSLDSGNKRIKMLIAIAAAILFVGLGGISYLLLAQKSSQIKNIRDQITLMTENDKIAKEIIGDIEKIENFENKQAVWLRELATLSNNFLDPDHVILNTATFTLDPGNDQEGIKIETSGFL